MESASTAHAAREQVELRVPCHADPAPSANLDAEPQPAPLVTVRQMLAKSSQTEDVPDTLTMDMFDLEAAGASTDDEWDDFDDGCLLDCFTLSTGVCASGGAVLHAQWEAFGVYLHNRRFWLCKIIIVIMDLAMLRGAFSMGEEYCTQDDEISEFGWVIWSSFLVFCKYVYLRPVFHLHQLGVFHHTRMDAAKSACLEFLCMICHVGLLLSLVYRTFLRGYSAYRSGSCEGRNRELITDVLFCQEAAEYYNLPSPQLLYGENRTKPLERQPPGCYYAESEEQLYFNPIVCSDDESWCNDWIAQTYGGCSKDSACLCSCSFSSAAVLLSVVVFTLPMPLQWQMFSSSLQKMREPPHHPQPAPTHDDGEEEGEGESGAEGDAVGPEGRRERERGGHLSWQREVTPARYASVMEDFKFGEWEGLHGVSALRDLEGPETAVGVGASNTRMRRLHKELSTLGPQLQQHPNSSIWVRHDADRPQFMRAAITGPAGTPYESGVFLFDLYCPPPYPQVPPKMSFLTTARGTVRFGPNLYADGKVCLSLLGTFDGPRWGPGSSLYQVLVSIQVSPARARDLLASGMREAAPDPRDQGMILGVAHPLYNEPGLGGFETGREDGGESILSCPPGVRRYDERTQLATLQHAILAHLRSPPPGFEEPVTRHFALKRGAVMAAAARWGREATEYRRVRGAEGLSDEYRGRLQGLVQQLRLELEHLPTCPETGWEGAGPAAAGTAGEEEDMEAGTREQAQNAVLDEGLDEEGWGTTGRAAAGDPRGSARRGLPAGAARGNMEGRAAAGGPREVEMTSMRREVHEESEESDDDDAVAAGAGPRGGRLLGWMGRGREVAGREARDDLSLLGRGGGRGRR